MNQGETPATGIRAVPSLEFTARVPKAGERWIPVLVFNVVFALIIVAVVLSPGSVKPGWGIPLAAALLLGYVTVALRIYPGILVRRLSAKGGILYLPRAVHTISHGRVRVVPLTDIVGLEPTEVKQHRALEVRLTDGTKFPLYDDEIGQEGVKFLYSLREAMRERVTSTNSNRLEER